MAYFKHALSFPPSKELGILRPFRMKKLLCALLVIVSITGRSAVLLDDTWADGDRTDTNLPEEAAWFGSLAGGNPSLAVASNALTGNVRVADNVNSRLWITHFTPAGSPVELAVGDTLKLSLDFIPRNVTASPATSRGLRIGLFNFSEPGAARVTGDAFSTGAGTGAPGTNVTGYMLNMNFAQSITINGPLQLMKRIDLATNNLMGASATFVSLGSNGGGVSGSPGFASDVPYKFEFTVRRLDAGVAVTTRFSDTNGWSMSHSLTDGANPYFKFDGFAMRPNNVADTADAFTFTRIEVEHTPYVVKITAVSFKTPTVLELRWDSLPGKTYEVHARSGLEPQYDWATIGTVGAEGSSASFEDGDVPFEIQRFYRIFQLP
jgi:hypothetical protein